MRLDDAIEFLRKRDPKQTVRLGFHKPHSYRGDYSQLGVEPVAGTTVGAMLEVLVSALDTTEEGWKGGEFVMAGWVDVYLAYWGDCGEMIGPTLLAFMCGETPPIPKRSR